MASFNLATTMTETFETPTTPLEERISAVDQAPEGDAEVRRDVLKALIDSRVTVLLDRPWDGVSPPNESTRLQWVSDGPDRSQPMLAVFSSETRARDFATTHGGFEHAVEVDSGWALLGVAAGHGVIINPNQPLGFRIDPEVARTLRRAVEEALAHYEARSSDPAGPPQ